MSAELHPEASVVMPCLNEADTLGTCIEKAKRAFETSGIRGEVVVADNGSTDGSREIAVRAGARMIPVEVRGYGSALMAGIAAARSEFVIMGDADDSYDFGEVPRFVDELRKGCDLVQGCRLPSGQGRIEPGAMPLLHRWIGNPMFSALARHWFDAPIHDVYCGLRGFRREFQQSLDQRCTGMEFATEMIIKASLRRARFAEVPITLHRDGRKSHAPHLKTFRDGWRTLRFFLLFSPRWLFLIPGLLLIALGLAGYAIAMPGLRIAGIAFDAHTLLFASLFLICGFQAALFWIMTKVFAINEGLLPEDPRLNRFFALVNLEKGLVLGGVAMVVGIVLLVSAIFAWVQVDFGALDYPHAMRRVVPGVTLTALGFQAILSGFFTSLLGMKRK